MKKTTGITLGIIMSALIASGCGESRRCVDANDLVVPDAFCEEEDDDRSPRPLVHHWYYGGSGTRIGSKATGGSTQSVSRGGFGMLASAHGGNGSS